MHIAMLWSGIFWRRPKILDGTAHVGDEVTATARRNVRFQERWWIGSLAADMEDFISVVD